jgi:uncharacterized protein involved in response to NO
MTESQPPRRTLVFPPFGAFAAHGEATTATLADDEAAGRVALSPLMPIARLTARPRERRHTGAIFLSAGFRPFFLLAAVWACVAVPLWLALYVGEASLPSRLPPAVWHAHEMVFGYGSAVVAGFLLTAIPNWTGRLPVRGAPLAVLAALWIAGRLAELTSGAIGPIAASAIDLAFPLGFLGVVAREIVAGRNWRNLPMTGALTLLLIGDLLVHLDALDLAPTASLGDRIGVATLLMLITLVGGRIVPSFTRNWLARERPEVALPAPFGPLDRIALGIVALTLLAWVFADGTAVAPWIEFAGGIAVAARLVRWRGTATGREPLLWILHLGYAWLAIGFLLLAGMAFFPLLPETTALHALTVGAIGTMTLAVMTRATLGHTGRPLTAGPWTIAIYGLVTLATLARVLAPIGGAEYLTALHLAGAAWSAAFGLFAALYGRPLLSPRAEARAARPI